MHVHKSSRINFILELITMDLKLYYIIIIFTHFKNIKKLKNLKHRRIEVYIFQPYTYTQNIQTTLYMIRFQFYLCVIITSFHISFAVTFLPIFCLQYVYFFFYKVTQKNTSSLAGPPYNNSILHRTHGRDVWAKKSVSMSNESVLTSHHRN